MGAADAGPARPTSSSVAAVSLARCVNAFNVVLLQVIILMKSDTVPA